jgi:hypothetical protein
MPYFVPSARATLLAPGFPDPTDVMSTPFDFAIRIAMGSVPQKYAMMIASIATKEFT